SHAAGRHADRAIETDIVDLRLQNVEPVTGVPEAQHERLVAAGFLDERIRTGMGDAEALSAVRAVVLKCGVDAGSNRAFALVRSDQGRFADQAAAQPGERVDHLRFPLPPVRVNTIPGGRRSTTSAVARASVSQSRK